MRYSWGSRIKTDICKLHVNKCGEMWRVRCKVLSVHQDMLINPDVILFSIYTWKRTLFLNRQSIDKVYHQKVVVTCTLKIDSCVEESSFKDWFNIQILQTTQICATTPRIHSLPPTFLLLLWPLFSDPLLFSILFIFLSPPFCSCLLPWFRATLVY